MATTCSLLNVMRSGGNTQKTHSLVSAAAIGRECPNEPTLAGIGDRSRISARPSGLTLTGHRITNLEARIGKSTLHADASLPSALTAH